VLGRNLHYSAYTFLNAVKAKKGSRTSDAAGKENRQREMEGEGEREKRANY
jgi:hypothetical protein